MRRLAAASVLLLATVCSAAAPATQPTKGRKLKADAPPAVVDLYKQQGDLRKDALRSLDERIKELTANLAKAQPARRQSTQDALQKVKDRRKQVADPAYLITPPLFSLDVGSIGTADPVIVSQVVDEHNVRIKLGIATHGRNARGPIVIRGVPQKDAWLSGTDTAGMTDDAVITEPMALIVVGTKRYETALNSSRTVAEVKPFKWDDYLTTDQK